MGRRPASSPLIKTGGPFRTVYGDVSVASIVKTPLWSAVGAFTVTKGSRAPIGSGEGSANKVFRRWLAERRAPFPAARPRDNVRVLGDHAGCDVVARTPDRDSD